MITGALKSQVDRVWDASWSGGISNPLTVIEQITYLLFAKRLDELHLVRERKANRLDKPIEDPIFSADQPHLRWSQFKDREAGEMYELFRDEVFPFIRNLHEGRESAYSRFMKDAVFVIPTPNLLQRVVTMLDAIPMEDRDTKSTVALADQMLNLLHDFDPTLNLKYNKFYIGLEKDGQPYNFVTFRPKKNQLNFEVKLPQTEELDEKIDQADLDTLEYNKRWDSDRIRLTKEDLKNKSEILKELSCMAYDRRVSV